jgi:Asp-tRNA(Asn)/Glu-tRNA(Gln) amidotransferase A subunit family amidase
MDRLFLTNSIDEIREKVTLGDISFVDLAEETSRIIESDEKNCLAWVCNDGDELKLSAEKAVNKFRERGELLALDGIPFGVKDIFNTSSFPTQMGSPIWRGFTPGNDARVVSSCVLEGGLVAGKTVTAEFAVHALNETKNPHDIDRTPGTSSSGSAVAVATGMVPYALASQTAGSIVRPASFCGVWGMKPSFGLIPRTGVLKTTDSLDTIGFVTSHAKNLRPLLNVVRVSGPDYPNVYKNVDKNGSYPKSSGRPFRVGYVKTHTWDTAENYVKRDIENLALRIGAEQGFDLEEITWPDPEGEAHSVHLSIYNKSLAYYFKNEMKDDTNVTKIMKEMIEAGKLINLVDFRRALQRQETISAQISRLFEPYDFVLSVGTASSAPLRGDEELRDPSLIWTLAHLPVVAAPAFRCPGGLPYGVQFVSSRWKDYMLLQGIEELVNRGILMPGSEPIIHV